LLNHSELTSKQKTAFFPDFAALLHRMVQTEQIEAFASEIARRYQPEKIILFGSQAWGGATNDSDALRSLALLLPETLGSS
jgi:hypothetical protein